MKLKALNIRSLPGLDPGFEIDFEPDAVERRDDIVDGRVGVEMRLQPFEGDLHAEIPPLSVGTFSAPNP